VGRAVRQGWEGSTARWGELYNKVGRDALRGCGELCLDVRRAARAGPGNEGTAETGSSERQEGAGAGGRYAIMMAGHTTPEMEAQWGDYGHMAQRLLGERGEAWDIFYVCDAQFPSDAELRSYDVSPFSRPCPSPSWQEVGVSGSFHMGQMRLKMLSHSCIGGCVSMQLRLKWDHESKRYASSCGCLL
jgi:hypothetical protein